MSRTLVFSSLVSLGLLVACGGPEVRHPYQADDKTPANSISETRLNGDDPSRPKAQVTSVTKDDDPTQAQVANVNDMPKGSDDSSSASSSPSGKDSGKGSKGGGDKGGGDKSEGKGAKPSKAGPKISKAECDKAFEKALELEIAARPELQGVDKKELMKMAKQMGAQQHGEAPCDASRAQYTCAMGATSTDQWKRCMQ